MPNLEGKITSNEISADLLELIGNGGGSGSSYRVDIPSYDWAVDGSLRSINVRHNLGGEVLFVSAYDTSTRENIILSYKILDGNNIKLYNAAAVNTTVIISASTASSVLVEDNTRLQQQVERLTEAMKLVLSSDQIELLGL